MRNKLMSIAKRSLSAKINIIEKFGHNITYSKAHHDGSYYLEYDYNGTIYHVDSSEKNPDEKLCGNCGIVKDSSLFYSHSSTFDNLQSWCKECTKKNLSRPHMKKFKQVELQTHPLSKPKLRNTEPKPSETPIDLIGSMITNKSQYIRLSDEGKNRILSAIKKHGVESFISLYNNSSAYCNDWNSIISNIDMLIGEAKKGSNNG